MSEQKTLSEFQKDQAILCFNKTWDYIDKPDRTPAEDLEMIHCAHTSRYLWGQVGTPLHLERGEWLISKVYGLIGSGERALVHAQACHDICVQNNIGDFDITFAYESLANAYKLLGDLEKFNQYKKLRMTRLAVSPNKKTGIMQNLNLEKSNETNCLTLCVSNTRYPKNSRILRRESGLSPGGLP